MGTFEALQAGDRTARVYVAGDFTPGTPGVELLHAWWGLNDDVTAYADRLAEAGFAVLAPDLYDGRVVTTPEEAKAAAQSVDEAAGDAIALAAAKVLARRLGPTSTLGAVGFSFGAAWAVSTPSQTDVLSRTVVYYGTYTGEILGQATVPVLGHFAEDDPFEDEETLGEFETGLRDARRDVTIHRYPGTGHWFAEPSRDAYRPEAADLAFERTVAFLRA